MKNNKNTLSPSYLKKVYDEIAFKIDFYGNETFRIDLRCRMYENIYDNWDYASDCILKKFPIIEYIKMDRDFAGFPYIKFVCKK